MVQFRFHQLSLHFWWRSHAKLMPQLLCHAIYLVRCLKLSYNLWTLEKWARNYKGTANTTWSSIQISTLKVYKGKGIQSMLPVKEASRSRHKMLPSRLLRWLQITRISSRTGMKNRNMRNNWWKKNFITSCLKTFKTQRILSRKN